MKRKFLGLFVASAVACNAFAQEEVAADSAAAKGLCHLSFDVNGGINFINSSKSNDRAALLPNSDFNPQVGAQVEYTFNPLWGLGLDYTWARNNQKKYENTAHEISLFASSNLSNLLAKYRSAGWQKFNTYLNAGLGAMIYDYEVTEGKNKGYENDGAAPLAWLGLNFEYNVSKYFAIGLDGEARRSTVKAWHPKGGENGGSWQLMANLGVRYKFGGDRNVRNVALVDYEPKVEVPDITPLLDEQKRQAAEMTSRLEEQINNQNSQIAKLQNELKATQDSLNKHIRDTKPAVRYTPTKEEDEIIKTAFSQLEFESAKAIIKQSSYSSLDGLATLLKAHQEWTVTLKGYTDNSGQAAKNLQLSKDRAAAVKAYLVNKGVSASKIQSFGYGSANPVASNTTLAGRAKNRRVEIELYSK